MIALQDGQEASGAAGWAQGWANTMRTIFEGLVANITEFLWYKERDEALIRTSNSRQRNGNFSLICDATLIDQ